MNNNNMSYIDLLAELYESISHDQMMPTAVKHSALRLVEKLQRLLWPYSA